MGTECIMRELIPVSSQKSQTWGHHSQLTPWYGGLLYVHERQPVNHEFQCPPKAQGGDRRIETGSVFWKENEDSCGRTGASKGGSRWLATSGHDEIQQHNSRLC